MMIGNKIIKMKKLFTALFISALLGCSSDDNSNIINTSNLLGIWTPEIEKRYTSAGEIQSHHLYSDEPCYHMTTFEYKSNSQLIKRSYDFDVTCIQNSDRIFTYSVSDNILTIVDGEDVFQYLLIENSTSILKLKIDNEDDTYTIIEYSKIN